MKPVIGKSGFMAGRKQKISVRLHTESSNVDLEKAAEEFWIEKITAKLQNKTETGEEAYELIRNVIER